MMQNNRGVGALRLTVLIVAVLFVAYGIVHGEAEVVLRKASIICLECIGIG